MRKNSNIGLLLVIVICVLTIFGEAKRDGLILRNEIVSPAPYGWELVTPVYATNFEDLRTEQDKIKDYIREVFGSEYDKVIQLLTDPRCHENLTLNPKASNKNWIKGKPGRWWSEDQGLMQINDYFHGHRGNLWNWKENIRIAKDIHDEWGGNFNAWTCHWVLER